jgi:guanosine-3',5'-bis(diphosphate) 3'-pyrophosphohydrolase
MPTTDRSLSRLLAALDYAAQQHRDQRRKGAGSEPYINHPIALLRILSVEAGIHDADVLTTALLHDVIEDCSGPDQEFIGQRRAEIGKAFGKRVLALVEAVTDDKSLPKEQRKQAQVEHAAHLPHRARLVKLADKIANVRDIGRSPPLDWDAARIAAYFDWSAAVVEALRGTDAKLERLFHAALAAARKAHAGRSKDSRSS